MNPFAIAITPLTRVIQANINAPMHSQSHQPSPNVCPGIILYYPGKKNDGLDYKLELNNQIVYHEHIAEVVYELSELGYGQDIVNFLVDIFNNGLNANHNINLPMTVSILGDILSIEQFKHLIFYTTLQEDMNYPRPRYFGVRMPYIRFIEAAIAAEHPNLLTLDDVVDRINIRNQRPPNGFTHPSLNRYLITAINQI